MTVNLGSIELGPEEAKALGLALSGKKRPATRAEVKTWALKLIGQKLTQTDPTKAERTELRNMVCPRCSKPIAVQVPCAGKAPGPDNTRLKQLAEMSRKAADALQKMAECCEVHP